MSKIFFVFVTLLVVTTTSAHALNNTIQRERSAAGAFSYMLRGSERLGTSFLEEGENHEQFLADKKVDLKTAEAEQEVPASYESERDCAERKTRQDCVGRVSIAIPIARVIQTCRWAPVLISHRPHPERKLFVCVKNRGCDPAHTEHHARGKYSEINLPWQPEPSWTEASCEAANASTEDCDLVCCKLIRVGDRTTCSARTR
ncbi:unnamed protein product [Amoebophrya sp. A25]|nr:unnamed protein product [Amoebophrya sp. A25]|eukprot:GSA25T00006674001.1